MSELDMGLIRGLITVVTLAAFLGICWRAYHPRSRDRFEADGWLAFDEDEEARLRRSVSRTSEGDRR